MSVVTNILILTRICETGINEIQAWLEENDYGCLNKISEQAGGYRVMECEVWAGAFNGFVLDEFIKKVKSIQWRFQKNEIQVLVRKEFDEWFSLIYGHPTSENSSYWDVVE